MADAQGRSFNLDSPLKAATLNIRGLLDLKKRRSVFRLLKKENIDIIALQETHICNDQDLRDIYKLWGGPIHHSSYTNRSKGLITLLHPRLKDQLFEEVWSSDRVLISRVELGNSKLNIVNVYCPCNNIDKIHFMNDLQRELEIKLGVDNISSTIVMGDFNIALSANLDIISGTPHPKNICDSFNVFIQSLSLLDTWRTIHKDEKNFTWSKSANLVASPPCARRLDYVFAGESLALFLKDSQIKSLGFSDHRMVVTCFESNSFKQGKGIYKLNTSLLHDREYINIIHRVILNTVEEYSSLDPHSVWEMIKVNIREVSKKYSQSKSREKKDRSEELQKQLKELEEHVALHPMDVDKWNQISTLKSELEIIEIEKAKGAQLRSRIRYIEEGEKNTKFFLNLEKGRGKYNTITKLKTADGDIITNELELIEEIKEKYKARYNKSDLTYTKVSDLMNNYINDLNLPSLNEEERISCDRTISEEEVRASLKSMKDGSAPGCDGIPTEFYKVFWNQLKKPLLNCINYSFQLDVLSPSERIGIISLFHKGKELSRDDLDNWRPISLTNTDYKIIAKILSIRLNTVLEKLIGKQQKGFMKGRQIFHIHRIIDDLLEMQRKSNLPGIILALDFKQAFDAISIHCIIKSLEIFGFGPNFIKWITILNTQRQSCVKNGGYISELFPMVNGVRQGCPISPQLFLLAVEILAQKIIQDKNIKGLNPHGAPNSEKISQFADDATLCLKDVNDINICFSHLNGFSTFSDLFLNLNKSYALSTNGMSVDTGGLELTFKDTIKILGLYFSNKKSASEIEDNWVPRINNILNTFAKWSKRDLSIMGKINIIKTFGISQFIYAMQGISFSKEVLDQVNTIFFRFLWKRNFDNKRAFEKIKRKTLCNSYGDGGLKMIDIHRLQDSMLLAWATQLLSSNNMTEWKNIAKYNYNNVGGLSVFRSKVDSTSFKGLHLIKSPFWKKVLTKWLDHSNNRLDNSLTLDDPICNNTLFQYRNNTLFLPTSLSKGIVQLKDIVRNGRLITFNEYINLYGMHARSVMDYNVIYNAIYPVFILNNPQNHANFSFRNIPIEKLNRKLIYSSLAEESEPPLCVGIWKRKFGIDITKPYWDNIFQLKEIRLREISWKICHNIYPTSIMLHRMQLAPSNLCRYCNNVDFIEHFFFHCQAINQLWNEIKNDILICFNVNIRMSEQIVLFGVLNIEGASRSDVSLINQLLAIGRMSISKFKYGRSRNLIEIYESDCALRKVGRFKD